MGEKISRKLRRKLIESSRRMRQTPTCAETLLWKKLRKRQIGGLRFRRQHIINKFIVDFYCPESKLVIEIDGSAHDKQEEYDQEREKVLEILGYQVVRFRNHQIENDLDSVLDAISGACRRRTNVE